MTTNTEHPTEITINGRTIQVLPLAKSLRNLIDHVNGMGPRHWYQEVWNSGSLDPEDYDYELEQMALSPTRAARSELNECGVFGCLFGEMALMHDIASEEAREYPGSWPGLGEALGLHPDMATLTRKASGSGKLFWHDRTRDEILVELEHRLAVELGQVDA